MDKWKCTGLYRRQGQEDAWGKSLGAALQLPKHQKERRGLLAQDVVNISLGGKSVSYYADILN